MNFKTQIHNVAMTRHMIDIETSLLLNIKANLENLLTEEIEGVDELTKHAMHHVWREEIKNIDLELIRRN
jgi:hypothetical protein